MTDTLNTHSQTDHLKSDSVADAEISLLNIVNFLQSAWKKLAVAAAVGAILGCSSWYFLDSYNAEIVINNNGGTNLIGWRYLQKTLPIMAGQIIDEGKVPQGQESLYHVLKNSDWWSKNVLANFGMSKAETKDLASVVGFEAAGTSIVSITIKVGGSSQGEAIENARNAKNFLLQGASYLAIKSMLTDQELQLITADADIEQKINTTQVELAYQKERLKNLEGLAKRFPGEPRTFSQTYNSKDLDAKYQSIDAQMIAVITEINSSKESLEHSKDTQAQIALLRVWVKQVERLSAAGYDGIALTKQLLVQESQLRDTLNPSDYKSLVFVDTIRSKLLTIDARFTKGLEASMAPIASGKKGMIKSTAGGLGGLFFLMLLALLGQRVLLSIKSSRIKS